MKKVLISLFLLLSSLCVSAQTTQTYKARVSSTDKSLQGEWVFLLNQSKKIDSAKLGRQGVTFTGQADPLALYTAKLGKYSVMLVPEGKKVRADIVKDESATGSPTNNELNKLLTTTKGMIVAFRNEANKINENTKISQEEKQQQTGELSQSVKTEYKKVNMDAFRKHPNNAVGYIALSALGSMISSEEFISLYDQAGERVKEYEELQRNYRLAVNAVQTSTGKPFINIVGVNPQDTTQAVHLADYVGKGKYVIADFWASWCGPCRREMPHLKEIYKKYAAKGVEVVGIGVWDKHADNIEAISQMQLPWPMLYDQTQSTCADTYGVMGIPTVILFDKDGTVISRDLRGKDLLLKLEELLQ